MVSVLRVEDLGGDVLRVTGLDDDGGEITATGWVSAMENHFPLSAYTASGHRLDGPEPRPMTDGERRAYWLRLLRAQNPPGPAVLYERQ